MRQNVLIQLAASADSSRMAHTIVASLIQQIAEIEKERGVKVDWTTHLAEKESYSARDVISAMGRALEDAGISSNLRDLAEELSPRSREEGIIK